MDFIIRHFTYLRIMSRFSAAAYGNVYLLQSDDPVKGWSALYLTAAASCIASAVCFLAFGPVEVEEWAKRATVESETTQLVE